MSAETLLSRLDGVRMNGEGRWLAKCPAHADRSPSLSIRETSDGTVLVKCFAGCGAADIVDAVGLRFSDLFPSREAFDHQNRPRQHRPTFDAVAAMHALAHEALVIATIANEIAPGDGVLAERLQLAVGRIHNALDAIGEPRKAPDLSRKHHARPAA
jgi:hypothetical protein